MTFRPALRRVRARSAWVVAITAGVLVATGGPLLPVTAAGPPAPPPAAAPAVDPAAESIVILAADELEPRPAPRHRDRGTAYRSEARLPSPPRVPLATWALADLDTGEILAARGARTRRQPASTIKLLSAVTAAERIAPRARHRVTREESEPLSCVCVGLQPGRRYTRDALMSGMLLVSGNDAAEALAGADPKGREGFLRAMNRTAVALGARDTEAVNPSGLTGIGGYSTARDLLVLLRAAQADDQVAPILGSRRADFGPVRGQARTIYRANSYVDSHRRSEGKTGYTRAAGFNLVVSTVLRDGDGRLRRIGAAAMGAPSRAASDLAVDRLTRWVAAHHDDLRPLGRLPRVPASASMS